MAEENEGANAEEEVTEEGAGKSGGKKKLIIIIVGVVLLLGIAGGAFMFLSGGEETKADETSSSETANQLSEEEASGAEAEQGDKAANDEKGKEGEAGAEKSTDEETTDLLKDVDFGETYTFKKFTLNLGNPLENRFVSMDISVEYTGGEKQKAEIERRLPQLRDVVVSVTSRKSREFLLGPDGKDQLRKEILNRLNRYMTKPLSSVYITDILIE